MPKEAEPAALNKVGNWKTAGSLPDSSDGRNIYCILNPRDF